MTTPQPDTHPTPTQPVHFVTVEHEHDSAGNITRSTLTFSCEASQDAPCRNYPSCDCEGWETGHRHPFVPQPTCWLEQWFDIGYDVTPYAGEDGDGEALADVPAGSGPITVDFDECIRWEWAARPAAPSPSSTGTSCGQCRRSRTPADALEYNPAQVMFGRPLGWYSGDDGEVCPQCMTDLLRRGQR